MSLAFPNFENISEISWNSSEAVTLKDIERMRKEFWETVYAYEGYKETWDVLKICIEHIHNKNFEKAQELLLYASITLPNGDLSECYNELGYKFEIPNYVLALPKNLKTDEEKLMTELPKGESESFSSISLNLSDNRKFTLDVSFSDTVLAAKIKLAKLCQVSESVQRWYFDGKALRNNVLLRKYQINPSYIIQVIVHKPKKPI